jgi:hypothetical protein
MTRRTWALWALLAVAGCSFDDTLSTTASIGCQAGDVCPAGQECRPKVGRCLRTSDLAGPALALQGTAVAPSRGGPHATFTLTFDVNRALFGPPRARAEVFAQAQTHALSLDCQACAPGAPCTCTLAPPADAPEGAYTVVGEATDFGGDDAAPVRAGSFFLDLTPPGLTDPPTLTVSPGAGAVTPVEQLGPRSTARLCFRVTEPLGADPVLTSAPAGLAFALADGFPSADHRYCFDVTAQASGLADGPVQLSALLVDTVGNAGTVALAAAEGPLLLKESLPRQPDLSAQAGLVHHRAPWGEPPRIGVPLQALRSRGPAIPEAGYLRVYADAAGQTLLAQERVAPGALPELALLAADQPRLWVELLDLAGNRPAEGPQPVLEGEWVATLGNKVAEDLTQNPHACFGRPVQGGALTQTDDPLHALDAASGPTGSGAVAQVRGAASWARRSPDYQLTSSVDGVSYAVDSARQRLVISNVGEADDGLFEWDGRDLHDVKPSGAAPAPRGSATLVYDARRGETVQFGGYDTIFASQLCDTWEWNGVRWRPGPSCLYPPLPDGGGVPAPRSYALGVFDPVRGHTVLLGGSDDTQQFNDLWAFDGARWTPLATPTPLPAVDSVGFVASGDGDGVLLLSAGTKDYVGRWDGATYQLSELTQLPSCGGGHGSPCPVSGFIARPGGGTYAYADGAASGTVEVWALEVLEDSWKRVQGFPTGYAIAGWASPRDGSLQFVGEDHADGCVDGVCLPLHRAGTLPSKRSVAHFKFDRSGRGLMYGGYDAHDDPTGDTWLWDGHDWTAVDGGPPGVAASLVYSRSEGRFWLAGGDLGDALWTLDPAQPAWRQTSATAFPDSGARLGREVAWLEDGGALYFNNNGDAELLRASGAQAVALGPMPPESGFGAYDASRNAVVLVQNESGALYEWTPGPGPWTQVLSGAGASGAPGFGPVVYDEAARRVLFVAGVKFTQSIAGDVQAWDGVSLVRVPLADPDGAGQPVSRLNAQGAYDPATQTTLVFSGDVTNGGNLQDTWELSLSRNRPAVVCVFQEATARLPAGTTLTRLRLEMQAAGSGGATAALWESGAFVQVGQVDGPDGGLAPLVYDAPPPRGLTWDRDAVGVAVQPAAANGDGLAQVQVTDLAVTLRYHLPGAP